MSYRSARLTAGALLLVALLGGCASMVPQTMGLRSDWPAGVPDRVEIADVPFFPQDDYQCGPAALATVLSRAGAKVEPADLVNDVFLPLRQGSLQVEMLAAPRRRGLVTYRLAPRFADLLREVAAGNPVIVLQDTAPGLFTNWHYAVVVGYDYPAGELYLRSGVQQRQVMPFTMLEYTWKTSDYWAMVAMPPGKLPATATETAYLSAITAMERVGSAEAAITAYRTFLARWPGNVAASVALANRYYTMGDLANTEAVLRAASVHNPASVVVLNNLAQALSDQGRNAEALDVIDRADRADSLFAKDVRETRAQIVQRLGRAN